MHGLAHRQNILDLYGYGWDIQSGNIIPFLVTELAAEGTLRHFLKNNELPIHDKLLFCKDIAQGLYSLHVAGIAHGDLKLDNVLVTPYVGKELSPLESGLRTTGMEARISDFGHSLHIYDDEGDARVKQRYGGTLAYNAPEILDKQRMTGEHVNFRKCDIWSLGLTCWETLIDEKAYYHNSDVEDSIMSFQRRTASSSVSTSNPPTQASSSSAMVEELASIAPQLEAIACKEIQEVASKKLTLREIDRLQILLKRCLESNPKYRVADIPLLPFFQGQQYVNADVMPPTITNSCRSKDASLTKFTHAPIGSGTSWSFEIFRIAGMMPKEVREQIILDCKKIANEPGASILAARASFQLGLAYAVGFGVPLDRAEAVAWFEKSADKGFRLAKLYRPTLQLLSDESPSHTSCLQQYMESNQRAFKAKFLSTILDLTDDTEATEVNDLDRIVLQKANSGIHGNDFDELENAGLAIAAKLGLVQTTHKLLGGASISMRDSQGCVPLHWLFMYPLDAIESVAHSLAIGDSPSFSEELHDTIVVEYSINHLSSFDFPQQLDPQLPLKLSGTPLAFAG